MFSLIVFPVSTVHGANMGPTWELSPPGGPHVGVMNLAIWVVYDALIKEYLLLNVSHKYV